MGLHKCWIFANVEILSVRKDPVSPFLCVLEQSDPPYSVFQIPSSTHQRKQLRVWVGSRLPHPKSCLHLCCPDRSKTVTFPYFANESYIFWGWFLLSFLHCNSSQEGPVSICPFQSAIAILWKVTSCNLGELPLSQEIPRLFTSSSVSCGREQNP